MSIEGKLEEDKYLWDGSNPGWVLVKKPHLSGGYSIINKINPVLLHIEDAVYKDALCRKMIDNGCEILEDIQFGNAEVVTIPDSDETKSQL